jgi:hypothetical protein
MEDGGVKMQLKHQVGSIPPRFPRLNSQTASLLGKKNLKNHKVLHRALERLAAAENAGVDLHDGAIIMGQD